MKTEDTRSDIMQAALDLIVEQGFHGAPVAEIAEKAGVAAGTIYRYFVSKDFLITELHRELEEKIVAVVQESYPSERPLRERFLYLIRELLRYFITNPLHFRYMEQYYNSPYGISLHRDRLLGKPGNQDILMDIFEQGIDQQVLKELPKAILFSLSFGSLISLMRDHILGFIVLDEALIKQTTEACWDAIKR
ncbi:MAG: TetR family transcriptional regulator [Syntrophobacterales bacterium CG_4_8_14_3_um_filter_58_8]|nr:MAG: TetR family transcriptional regulator [Syntrophaceae bacterium CG2_30_58_14]PIV04755.1 MAG: TetR family transcriptional regulator [Syntrophobacterales bacterium CG03_land_8_20_14_0_80_58_14]PJC71949.1 MAG: TetR family transcriptional regulator [Syntrophobacterales bacterium CG_4_8_14_3_um_filter_58_8]